MPTGEHGFGNNIGKESSYNKVIAPGISDEGKKVILGDLAESFQNPPELPEELEKTPAEKEILKMADHITSQVLKSYGLKPLTVPEQNIKIVTRVEIGSSHHGGEMEPRRQILKLERGESNLVAFHRSIHEMLHIKSFGAIQTIADKPSEIDFNARSGLAIRSRDGSRRFFWPLNEAVTESLSIAAMNFILKDKPPIFAQEIAEAQLAKQGLNALDNSGNRLPLEDIYFARRVGGRIEGNSFVYQQERHAFDQLVEKIYKKLGNFFTEEGDVREQFYIAYFSGNIRVIAEAIDGVFGKGTFRKIGEAQTKEELASVIDSL